MMTGKWSARAAVVARWFGVSRDDLSRTRLSASSAGAGRIVLGPGEIVLITGASGAGKSTLLRRIGARYRRRRRSHRQWIDLARVRLPAQVPVIDLIVDALCGAREDEGAIIRGLDLLSRLGLGEVWTYLRTPEQLSEGQRWRLRLGIALARAAAPTPCDAPRRRARTTLTVVAADEFCAALDPVTALVVARALRRAVDCGGNVCAVVATAQENLAPALSPDLVVQCDFGAYQIRAGVKCQTSNAKLERGGNTSL
jgi:ABC-type ATPase with predicted acetyltransferase domain